MKTTTLARAGAASRAFATIGLSALMLTGASAPLRAQETPPDYIVYNANVLTVDTDFSRATAFAVRNGMFSAVGADGAVLATAGPKTVRIDLKGRTVMPGFTDSHAHVLNSKGFPTSVDFTDMHSIEQMKAAIAARAKTAKPGEWIRVSRGWWEYNLAEKRNPTKADLDAAAPNNPVMLQVTHFSIVNSAALRAAGITRDTPDPQGGEIEKDANGEPNGILWDKASGLVGRLVPKLTPEQEYDGLHKMLQRLNAAGIVAIREMGGTQADADLYRRIYANGDLTVRIDFCYNTSPQLTGEALTSALDALGAPGKELGAGMFRADCLAEVGVDGATGLTAHTREDYPTRKGYRGIQMVSQENYDIFAAEVAKRYWRLAVHSSGDAGIDQALTAFEKANVIGRRWTIEHGNTLRPDQYGKFKQLKLLINSQYAHLAEGGKKTLDGWGPELSNQTQRFKDWLAAGIEFSAGSDGPISYKAEPLYWMFGMVTRQTDWGGSIGPDQGITREQAVRSFTAIPAKISFAEDVRGSIEKGKYADFVVVAADVMTVPIEQVRATKVLATVVGGKTVYGTLGAGAAK